MGKREERRPLTARGREMAAMLRACDRSGLSQAAFARQHGLTPGVLAWWRHVLRRGARTGPTPAATFVEVVPVRPPDEPAAAPGLPFEVIVPPGVVVRVPAAFDPGALRRLLAVLARPC